MTQARHTHMRIHRLALAASLLMGVPAAQAQSVEAKFESADTDGDGRLSLHEYLAGGEQAFRAIDKNKDGIVTARELAEHLMSDSRNPMPLDGALIVGQAGVREWDRNGDGRASWDAYRAYQEGLFRRSDANGDGQLTLEEFKTFARGD